LEANYGKKIGLPQYSSHQFQVAVKSEVAHVDAIAAEVDRLYGILQAAVDRNIREAGLMPGDITAERNGKESANGRNGHASVNGRGLQNGTAHANNGGAGEDAAVPEAGNWACSDKQRGYLLDLLERNGIGLEEVARLADQMYSKELPQLNRLEASALIDEVKGMNGGRHNGTGFANNGRNGHGNNGAHNGRGAKANWRRVPA
jgi:hypothetical protein